MTTLLETPTLEGLNKYHVLQYFQIENKSLRKEHFLKYCSLVISLIVLCPILHAANKYWISSTSSNWNNVANWSSTSGGVGGSLIPASADDVFFDNLGLGNCNIDATVSIKTITINAAYTGTLSQNSNAISIASTGTFNGGTFLGGSSNITIIGAFSNSGTTFNSTSAILEFRSTVNFSSGTFTHNNGTVRFNATAALAVSGISPTFYILEFVGTGQTYTLSSVGNIGVLNSLNVTGSSSNTINAGTIAVQGNINISNSAAGGGGTATILINGTGAQIFSSTAIEGSGRVPLINISKSSGILSLSGIITEMANWTYLSGNVDATNSTISFGGPSAIIVQSAGMNFYNFSTFASTTTISNNLSVNNTLSIKNGSVLASGSNTINLYGNWNDIATAGAGFHCNTGTVNFLANSLQSITKTAAGGEIFYNVTINNSGVGVQLMNTVLINNALTMTLGNIDLNGNGLTLGTSTINPGTLSYISGSVINVGNLTRWFKAATIADGSVTGLFPTGTSNNYRPIFFSAPTSAPTTGGTIKVSYTDASTNTNVFIIDGASAIQVRKDLNWNVSTSNGLSGGNYDMEIQGTGFGMIGSVSDIRISLANSVVGIASTNAGTTSNPTVIRTGLTLANLTDTFFIGSINLTNSPLPVHFLSFTANRSNSKVLLEWQIGEDASVNGFELFRSQDGINWEIFRFLHRSYDINRNRMFSDIDEKPINGITYYRVKMLIDGNDGYYSSIIKINENGPQNKLIIYPNPAMDKVYIDLPNSIGKEVHLFNSNGKELLIQQNNLGNQIKVNFGNLLPGIYFMNVLGKSFNSSTEIIIKK